MDGWVMGNERRSGAGVTAAAAEQRLEGEEGEDEREEVVVMARMMAP
jgi:hypothetical protein